MLFFSLILSLVLVLIANAAVHSPSGWRPAFFICGLVFTFGTIPPGVFLPPVALAFVLLAVVQAPWFWGNRKPWRFLPVSCLAALIAFAIPGWFALRAQREYARLRGLFPCESMESRLPAPTPDSRVEQLPRDVDRRLDELEEILSDKKGFGLSPRRVSLRMLHEDTISLFVNSPGFGVARFIRPSERHLTGGLRPRTLVDQPEPTTSSSWALEVLEVDPLSWDEDLYRVHRDGVVDFADPGDFGYFKDRRHVAGFQPHQFSELPAPAQRWSLRRLDLVSLLLHKEPAAYVTNHLPRMDELAKVPTRPLNSFESSAVEKLRRGEDLVLGRTEGDIRMVGALRSAKQCVNCHGGRRGDLLGAFSYVLRRKDR